MSSAFLTEKCDTQTKVILGRIYKKGKSEKSRKLFLFGFAEDFMTFSWLEWLFYPILVVLIIFVGILALSPARSISEDVALIANTLLKGQRKEKPRNKLEEKAAKLAVKDRNAYLGYK